MRNPRGGDISVYTGKGFTRVLQGIRTACSATLRLDVERNIIIKDSDVDRVMRIHSFRGAHVTGSVCSPPRNHPHNYFRSHGELKAGDLLISFSTAINDTNDWPQVLVVLESLRFEQE